MSPGRTLWAKEPAEEIQIDLENKPVQNHVKIKKIKKYMYILFSENTMAQRKGEVFFLFVQLSTNNGNYLTVWLRELLSMGKRNCMEEWVYICKIWYNIRIYINVYVHVYI